MDIRELHRRAVESTGAIVDALTDEQLDLPTPCDKWTVREVIGHMVDNNRNLIARVTGDKPEFGDDPRRAYRDSAAWFTKVFAEDSAWETRFEVGVLSGTLDGRAMQSVHSLDVLVHGWDLGRAIGVDVRLDPELVEVAYGIVSGYPDAPGMWSENGGIFGPKVEPGPDADAQERLLAITGRRADWGR